MAALDVRPGTLNVVFRPGNAVTIELTWPDGVLDGRSFVAFLGDEEVDVDVTGEVMTVAASPEVTSEHGARSAAWVLAEDSLDVLITGTWSPSLRGSVSPNLSAVVVVGDTPNVTVEVAVVGGSGGVPLSQKGAPDGVAPLDADGFVPVEFLPPGVVIVSEEP